MARGGDAAVQRRRAFAALLVGVTAIGLGPILVRWSEVGPVGTGFWRLALSLPVLGWLVARGAAPRTDGAARLPWPLLVATGICFAGDLATWHWSIRLTSIANATLLSNMAPVLVALATWLLTGSRGRPLFWAGLALGVAGAGLLVGASSGLGGSHLAGDAWGLASAVFYASYLMCVARLRRERSTAVIMFATSVVGALVLAPLALATGEALLPATTRGWTLLALLALFGHVIGQGLIAYALAHLPATLSSVVLLLQPVIAAAAAWALCGEALVPLQGLGAVAIVAGILLAGRGEGGGPGARPAP